MRKTILIILLVLTQVIGCKDREENPSRIITLDSNIQNGLKGLDFESGVVITYTNANETRIDLIVLVQIEQNDGIVGPFFSSPKMTSKFEFVNSFITAEEATEFFDNYIAHTDKNDDIVALNLLPNQIWTIRTPEGKLVKLLILETQKGSDINNPFAQTTFKWDFIE